MIIRGGGTVNPYRSDRCMTLHDLMPAIFLSLAFVFFVIYVLSRMRLMLTGCGASFAALCPALLGLPVFADAITFFIYTGAVCGAAYLCKREKKEETCNAIALTRTDARGGYILCGGRIHRACPRDSLYEYALGDVLNVITLPDGTLCAYRV